MAKKRANSTTYIIGYIYKIFPLQMCHFWAENKELGEAKRQNICARSIDSFRDKRKMSEMWRDYQHKSSTFQWDIISHLYTTEG